MLAPISTWLLELTSLLAFRMVHEPNMILGFWRASSWWLTWNMEFSGLFKSICLSAHCCSTATSSYNTILLQFFYSLDPNLILTANLFVISFVRRNMQMGAIHEVNNSILNYRPNLSPLFRDGFYSMYLNHATSKFPWPCPVVVERIHPPVSEPNIHSHDSDER